MPVFQYLKDAGDPLINIKNLMIQNRNGIRMNIEYMIIVDNMEPAIRMITNQNTIRKTYPTMLA